MPSEAFLKLLARKNAAIDAGGNEGVSVGEPVSEALVVEGVEVAVDKASHVQKDKVRKRHREGGCGRHHHKKGKDANRAVVVDDGENLSRGGDEFEGAEASRLSELRNEDGKAQRELVANDGGSVARGNQVLKICKEYAEKVIYICHCSVCCFVFIVFLIFNWLRFRSLLIWGNFLEMGWSWTRTRWRS